MQQIILAVLCGIAKAHESRSLSGRDYAPGGSASSSPASAAAAVAASEDVKFEELNSHLDRDYLIALAAFVFAVFIYRVILYIAQYTRTLASIGNGRQHYFAVPNFEWAVFKKTLLYAPLFRTRHHRECRLSAAIQLGFLPTRFQTLVLLGILGTNIALCVYAIPWSSPGAEILPILRNRIGTIAVANLIPIMLLSSPKNPLIRLLNVSFESMNTMHRNFARMAVVEAVAHCLCWLIPEVRNRKSDFSVPLRFIG